MIALEDLRYATGGQLFGSAVAEEFTDFCHDPHLVAPGQLYVALRAGGEDGHRYIEQALDRGAAGVLCERPPRCDTSRATVVIVGDVAAALGQWAAYVLRRYGTTVIGVAGAVGKSSARQAIATVLRSRYRVYDSPHVMAGRVGLSISLGGLQPEHEIVLLELTTHHLGEMPDLLGIAQPHIGVITTISPGYPRDYGEAERVEVECRQLIAALPAEGVAILNVDDERTRWLSGEAEVTVFTYGQSRSFSPALLARDVHLLADAVGFDLQYGDVLLSTCRLPLLGCPGLYAGLAALAVGSVCDIALEEGIQALSNLTPLAGHLNLLEGINGCLLIDDTYNASPASTMAALDLLAAPAMSRGRRIFVLGDMDSRGEAAEQSHREVGRRAAQVADLFVTQGAMASIAGRAARWVGAASERTILTYSHADTAAVVRSFVNQGDIVLITGGQQARMERVVERLLASPGDTVLLTRREPQATQWATTLPAWTSWIELDLEGLAHNITEVRQRLAPDVALMALVGSNAYGHGAEQVASTAISNGAVMLGVTSLGEGLSLREAGINAPILILGHIPTQLAQQAILNDLTLTIYDRESARLYALMARELKRNVKVHIRVDSGLGQLGLLPDQVVPLVRELVRLEGLTLDGLYTEFSSASNLLEAAATHEQLAKFRAVIDSLRVTGLRIPYIHAASSAAILTLPESHFSMVRLGLLMFGLNPSPAVPCPPGFRRVLTWKTTIAQTKTIPMAWSVGYDGTYQARSEEQIAIIPVGFADGFWGTQRNWGEVLVRGQRAPLVGRVSMNQAAIRISHIPDVQVGDEVVLIGAQGEEQITVEDIARRLDMSTYEVVSGISSQIPRIS